MMDNCPLDYFIKPFQKSVLNSTKNKRNIKESKKPVVDENQFSIAGFAA